MKKAMMMLVLAVCATNLEAQDEEGPVGRYQLVVSRDPMHAELTDIWKIDTVTGQVWRFYLLDEDTNTKKSVGGFIPADTAKP